MHDYKAALRPNDPMTPSAAPDKPITETVLPDYGNAGVVFRVLLAVNLAVLMGCLLSTSNLLAGFVKFVEVAALVEWVCLTSILLLLALQRMLLVTGILRAMAPWSQRALSMVVPAIVTGLCIHFLQAFIWFRMTYAHLSVADGVLFAGLAGMAVQHYFELRTRAFSPALAEARLQALQARIRPHFLFNSLNAVLSLIRLDPRRAETALEDLSELFRVSMRDTSDMTTLDQEIRLCRQYLSIEKIRLGDRLEVAWDTEGISEEELLSARIATLMLQPLLENAVNYGVEPSHAPTRIDVRIRCSLGTVEIMVANPVPAAGSGQWPDAGGNRMALGNIRERLALLYDAEAQLSSGIVDGHFEARLRFPYQRMRA